MEYKRNWKEAVERQEAFWRGRMPDRVLARVNVRNRPLERWLAEKGPAAARGAGAPDPETVLGLWEARLAAQRDVEDDSLPVMIPSESDEGLFGALFGAAVEHSFDPGSGWFSSMARPFLPERTDPARLFASVDEGPLERHLGRLRTYGRRAAGRFGLSPVISIDSLNFAVMARGAMNAYMDLHDDPAWLAETMRLSVRLALRCHAAQREAIGGSDGTFDGYAAMGARFPGTEIDASVDAFGACGEGTFRSLGLPLLQELVDGAGSAFLHVHGNAHHLLPALRGVRGLRGLWIVDEEPHPFPRLAEIRRLCGPVPLVTECLRDEFLEALDAGTLPGGVFYMVRGHKEGRSTLLSPAVEAPEEANRIMEKVRAYRAGNAA